MKKNTVQILKKVGLALLAVGIIGGTVALGNKVYQNAKATDRSFNPKFEVGGLVAETGEFENDLTTVYTKEAFKAKGLKVKVDIDASITYRVYFYDQADAFLSCTEELNKSQAIEVPEGALARIEVGPRLGIDEVAPELTKFDAYKYSKIMELTVDKKQDAPAKKTAQSPALAIA